MRRGEVYWVNFEPTFGGEIKKTRPAVLVSNNAAIQAQNRVQVIPLTTAEGAQVRPWQARVTVGDRQGRALADQIRTVAKERIREYVGTLSPIEMLALEQAIRVQLGLP